MRLAANNGSQCPLRPRRTPQLPRFRSRSFTSTRGPTALTWFWPLMPPVCLESPYIAGTLRICLPGEPAASLSPQSMRKASNSRRARSTGSLHRLIRRARTLWTLGLGLGMTARATAVRPTLAQVGFTHRTPTCARLPCKESSKLLSNLLATSLADKDRRRQTFLVVRCRTSKFCCLFQR